MGNLRNIIITTAVLFVWGVSTAVGQIRIENRGTTVENGQLNIAITVIASGLEVGGDDLLKLEFSVDGVARRVILPTVVYVGKQRYRYEQRNLSLSGEYDIPPYHTYRGVDKKESYVLDYELAIPYYPWMEHARVIYREYRHTCGGEELVAEGLVVADVNPAPVVVEWSPDPSLFSSLVYFLNPEVEQVKNRAAMLALNIDYPVNISEVRPMFGRNARELEKVDTLMSVFLNNELITVNSINITGFASPEGRYAVNESLAKRRSESFKSYMTSNYYSKTQNINTYWVAEDWEGLGRLVEAGDMEHKMDILSVVNDMSLAPDTKERIIKQISRGVPYKILLDEVFPSLRRIELRTDYVISNLSDSEARELLYTQPDMLNLNEIYRVALFYEPGSKQYREVYEIAAKMFPREFITNNNAAAAILQGGNAEDALPYLNKMEDNPAGYLNRGVYHYILGERDKATECFVKAKEAGVEQADKNLQLIN